MSGAPALAPCPSAYAIDLPCAFRGVFDLLGLKLAGTTTVRDLELTAPIDSTRLFGERPPSRRVRLEIPLRPRYSSSDGEFRPRGSRRVYGLMDDRRNENVLSSRIKEMAEQGYVLESSSFVGGVLRMRFVAEARIVPAAEKPPEPSYVATQRAALRARFPLAVGHMGAAQSERFYSEAPTGLILSARTLANYGKESFVLLDGENFLRLGSSHPALGAKEIAHAAGDITIARDPSSPDGYRVRINPRSDAYRPPEATLALAVEALWAQGVYPRRLQLTDWEERQLLLDLSVD